MSRSRIAIAIGLLIAAGGCGEANVDTRRAEREIRRDLAAATGARVRTVRCPDRVEAKKGEVFRCSAILSDHSSVPVRVKQIDDDGGVRWRFPTL